MADYVDVPFAAEVIDSGDLKARSARELCAAVEELPYVEVAGCLRAQGDLEIDVVILDVEVERPQHVRHAIERMERVAVVCTTDSSTVPDVLALRADFPQVPHLNLRTYDRPKSLCLYDEGPREIMLRWTPLLFIERIRQWLALTTRGELHQGDQPLEPLLLSSVGTIVLPDAAYENLTSADNLPVTVYRASQEKELPWMLIAETPSANASQKKAPFLAMGFLCEPTVHGVIRRQPHTLDDLASLVEDCGLDLIAQLRARLTEWCKDKQKVIFGSDSLPILLLAFPKAREPGGPVESTELWVFAGNRNMLQLGTDLGIWDMANGSIGLALAIDDSKRGQAVGLIPMKPVRSFSSLAAAVLSGHDGPDDRKFLQIGVGALGSHLFLNLVRAGVGRWTVVDNDRLLPHNLARHALDGRAVGHFKTECLSMLANDMIDGDPVCRSMVADVLAPGEKSAELAEALAQADIVIDASASLSVARHVALDVDSDARRISVFVTPAGGASVLLAEDADRSIPLDVLEMQYYRTINNFPELKDHLSIAGEPIRYGQSCRDLTSRIPQDVVALHAALCSNATKQALDSGEATASIWSFDKGSGDVSHTSIPVAEPLSMECGAWHVKTDKAFVHRLAELRAGKLPNETGGVILGSYDMQRKLLYLVDTIPSPPDSKEWPTVYIRGCRGLPASVKEAEERTAGNLTYVGEWHSHPDGASLLPSLADITAFAWLSDNMRAAGLPPMMVIVGQDASMAVYVEAMEPA